MTSQGEWLQTLRLFFSLFGKPSDAFLAIEKERQEMEFPIVIITRKRWREMEVRAARAERAVDVLTHRIDTIRDGLAAVERTADCLRFDVRDIRRKLNEKQRQSWPHGTFTGSAASNR